MAEVEEGEDNTFVTKSEAQNCFIYFFSYILYIAVPFLLYFLHHLCLVVV
jgi:hypothetical protein